MLEADNAAGRIGYIEKKYIHLIASRNRDLPACSVVPQSLSYRVQGET
jgi:hypothetical protein